MSVASDTSHRPPPPPLRPMPRDPGVEIGGSPTWLLLMYIGIFVTVFVGVLYALIVTEPKAEPYCEDGKVLVYSGRLPYCIEAEAAK